jgi:SWI/SNF-related matrix-associated actin-dependent regulator 1 of chromatin subfamily A
MKKILAQNLGYHHFAFYFDYEETIVEFCRWIKATYGYQNFTFYGFNGTKAWIFSDPQILAAIKNNYPDTELDLVSDDAYRKALVKMGEDERIETRAIELKSATDSDIKIPNLKLPLYPYQKVGVEFFINNQGRAILADQMGTGKTATSLAYIVYKGSRRSLVICPASVKFAWKDEVEKWTTLRCRVVQSSDDKEVFKERADIFIINYDIVRKFKDSILSRQWEVLICDEFHMIKNSQAQRTKSVKEIAKGIESCLLLSGTPLLNKPVELFNGLNLMDPRTWNNYSTYVYRYCGAKRTRYGLEVKGATNIEELQQRIQKYFLRRTKEQVLKDLPPKRFISIPVELEPSIAKEYSILEASLRQYLLQVKKKKGVDVEKTLGSEHLVKLGHMRQLTTRGKLATAEELIKNIVDSGEKVVVFSNYHEPLVELNRKFFSSSVLLTGQTKVEDRREMVEEFQQNKNIRIFFGGIKSAGVGITLTSGTVVVFIDYSWVPADHSQAIDRIHRIGQTAEAVTIYQLFARHTIDEMMKKLLEKKQVIFDRLIEGRDGEALEGDVVSDLLAMVKAEEFEFTVDSKGRKKLSTV